MSNNKYYILTVADQGDHAFWSMIDSLNYPNLEVVSFSALEQLFGDKLICNAQLIAISTSVFDDKGIQIYFCNKEYISCPVVIAGSYENIEQEYEARKAGVSCMLLLPDESCMLNELIQDILSK